MNGHTLPGPYQKKGDPVPEKMIPKRAQQIVTEKEKKANQEVFKEKLSAGISMTPSKKALINEIAKGAGGTVDPRKKDPNKSLKRAPLKKKGDPKVSKSQAKSANRASGNVTLTKTRKDGSVRKTISSTTSGPSRLSSTTPRKSQGVKTKTTKTKFKKDGSVKKTKTLKAPRRKTRGSQEQYLKARENLYQKGDLVSDTKVKRKKS